MKIIKINYEECKMIVSNKVMLEKQNKYKISTKIRTHGTRFMEIKLQYAEIIKTELYNYKVSN